MTDGESVKDGWRYFWRVPRHSYRFIVGFALAYLVSALIYEGIKLLAVLWILSQP